MGSVLTRNRFWLYRSLYDDYAGREVRLSFFVATFLGAAHYYYGLHINRQVEENFAHVNYAEVYAPRRNRLTHSMLFEEFDEVLDNWKELCAAHEGGAAD